MEVIFINTTKDGYNVDQCGETLTVRELMELLAQYPKDTPVYFRNDGGYTYGSVGRGIFRATVK